MEGCYRVVSQPAGWKRHSSKLSILKTPSRICKITFPRTNFILITSRVNFCPEGHGQWLWTDMIFVISFTRPQFGGQEFYAENA